MTDARLIQRPLAWWGVVLAAMVLATVYAAMYFTYVYVRVSSALWPPEGIPQPALRAAALSALALAASSAAITVARRSPLPGLLAAIAFAGVHGWLVVGDWAQPGFDPRVHAYGSASVVLPAVHLVVVAVGVVVATVVAGLAVRGHDVQVTLGVRVLAVWWHAQVVGGLLLLALVYATPHVWSQPWPAT